MNIDKLFTNIHSFLCQFLPLQDLMKDTLHFGVLSPEAALGGELSHFLGWVTKAVLSAVQGHGKRSFTWNWRSQTSLKTYGGLEKVPFPSQGDTRSPWFVTVREELDHLAEVVFVNVLPFISLSKLNTPSFLECGIAAWVNTPRIFAISTVQWLIYVPFPFELMDTEVVLWFLS